VRTVSGLSSLAVVGMLVACASSGRSEAEPALVFSSSTVPRCAFEPAGEVTVYLTMRGDRVAVEERLHSMLAREAARKGADGILNIALEAERVTVAVPMGTRPTEADLPAIPWTGRARAIRFLDSDCRG